MKLEEWGDSSGNGPSYATDNKEGMLNLSIAKSGEFLLSHLSKNK